MQLNNINISKKKPIFFVRLLLILVSSILGFLIGKEYWHNDFLAYVGLLFGFITGFIVITLEKSMENISTRKILSGGIGLFISLYVVNYLTYKLFKTFFTSGILGYASYAFINFVAGYIGLIIGLRASEEVAASVAKSYISDSFGGFSRRELNSNPSCGIKIIDTSSLIDGRILDVAKTKFIEGKFIIPTFVLHELQHIADSQDPLKRVKGRRGLDMLNEMREDKNINIEFIDKDYLKIREVDAKLTALAKEMNAKIITNDFNLNKVAQVQNIQVLNINDLAKALRPILLPGETMNILIAKEGREKNQGIGYMDDGTMIVVEDAMRLVGTELEVVVTSILQTSSGRMIFARINHEHERERV